MTSCGCPNLNEYITARAKPYFSLSNYCDAFLDGHIIRTRGFTTETEDVEIMCPRHHPFFYYLAGMLHLQPDEIQKAVQHAWNHTKSNELKILLRRDAQQKVQGRMMIGLYKAWRGYSGKKTSCVYTYTEELGHFYTDDHGLVWEDEDECKCCDANDGWVIMQNLGHILWSAKFG